MTNVNGMLLFGLWVLSTHKLLQTQQCSIQYWDLTLNSKSNALFEKRKENFPKPCSSSKKQNASSLLEGFWSFLVIITFCKISWQWSHACLLSHFGVIQGSAGEPGSNGYRGFKGRQVTGTTRERDMSVHCNSRSWSDCQPEHTLLDIFIVFNLILTLQNIG